MCRTEVPPTFPFLSLPIEIQYKICISFCGHCRCATGDTVTLLSYTAGVEFRTLKALSETCQALKDMAQPILYHHPDIKVYGLFFRTLLARPDLRPHVRVFSRMYESLEEERPWKPYSNHPEREDFDYLKSVARQLGLYDDADPDFQNCFDYIFQTREDDLFGYSNFQAHATFNSLITSIVLVLAAELQMVAIDIDDGLYRRKNWAPRDGQFIQPFPYLPRFLSENKTRFDSVHTVIFRNPYHYMPDNLGLHRLAFVLPALPNIRHVMFQHLAGDRPLYYNADDCEGVRGRPELDWTALQCIQRLSFHTCARYNGPVPYVGIQNLVQKCTRLSGFMFRLKYPDNPALFSPAELVGAILPATQTLTSLELFCSLAKIPHLINSTLLDKTIGQFIHLTRLVLDEQLFCHHWEWIDGNCPDTCLVSILPQTLTNLTIRLHDKYKAGPDILRLGRDTRSGHFPSLARLQVDVLHDMGELYFHWHQNESLFDSQYLLYEKPAEEWEKTLDDLVQAIRPLILDEFKGTGVIVRVDLLEEQLFPKHEKYDYEDPKYLV